MPPNGYGPPGPPGSPEPDQPQPPTADTARPIYSRTDDSAGNQAMEVEVDLQAPTPVPAPMPAPSVAAPMPQFQPSTPDTPPVVSPPPEPFTVPISPAPAAPAPQPFTAPPAPQLSPSFSPAPAPQPGSSFVPSGLTQPGQGFAPPAPLPGTMGTMPPQSGPGGFGGTAPAPFPPQPQLALHQPVPHQMFPQQPMQPMQPFQPMQPMPPQQPGQPGMPNFAAAPANGAMAPPPRRHKGRLRKFIKLGVVAAVLIGGAALVSNMLNGSQTASADILFQQAVENTMRTKSFTETVTNPLGVAERKVDVSDIRNPRISSTVKQNADNLEVEGYATVRDTIINIKQSDKYGPKGLNTWVQVRKDGNILDQAGRGGQALDLLFTPMSWLFDSLIQGNYEQIDSANMLTYLREKHVFQYDPTKATDTTHDGRPAKRYAVTVSGAAHNELFKKAAELAGIDKQQIDMAITLANLDRSNAQGRQYTLYVDEATQRFVKAEYTEDNQQTTMVLTGFDETKVGAAPTAATDWNSFIASIGK